MEASGFGMSLGTCTASMGGVRGSCGDTGLVESSDSIDSLLDYDLDPQITVVREIPAYAGA